MIRLGASLISQNHIESTSSSGGGGGTTYNITAVNDDGHVTSSRTSSTSVPQGSFSSLSKNSQTISAGAQYDDEEIELNYFVGYFRFDNIVADQGATIQSAILKPIKKSSVIGSAAVDYEIAAIDKDDPSTPSSASDLRLSNRTTARVTLPKSTVTSTTNGDRFDSPDIKTVIQEIVNRSGWSSGNAILLVLYTPTNVNGGSATFGRFGSKDGTDQSAQLEITI